MLDAELCMPMTLGAAQASRDVAFSGTSAASKRVTARKLVATGRESREALA